MEKKDQIKTTNWRMRQTLLKIFHRQNVGYKVATTWGVMWTNWLLVGLWFVDWRQLT